MRTNGAGGRAMDLKRDIYEKGILDLCWSWKEPDRWERPIF